MAKKKAVVEDEYSVVNGQELWVVPCDVYNYCMNEPDKKFPMKCVVTEGGGDYYFSVSNFKCEFDVESMSACEYSFDEDEHYSNGYEGVLLAYETYEEAKDYIKSYSLSFEISKELEKLPIKLSLGYLNEIMAIIENNK